MAGMAGIDILINDLAADFAKPFADMSYEEWRMAIDQNLDAVFVSCQTASGRMLAKQNGRIVNITSGLGARRSLTRPPFLRRRPE